MRRLALAIVLLAACDPAVAAPPPAPAASADAHLRALKPGRTRAGHLRFNDPALADPGAAAVFAARLADPTTPVPERRALAEALPRCGGAWEGVVLQRLALEADPEVRAVLVGALRRADVAHATAGARAGLADADAVVRRAAADLAGWVPGAGAELKPALRARLADPASEVRAAAGRALGLLGDAAAFADLVRNLGDADTRVRLEALRALQRIDPTRAAALPERAALQRDPDPRIRRAAG